MCVVPLSAKILVYEGKWHLGKLGNDNSYSNAVSIVEACGFDTVGGLYFENLDTVSGLEPDYSHNMEWMVSEAISFINESVSFFGTLLQDLIVVPFLCFLFVLPLRRNP